MMAARHALSMGAAVLAAVPVVLSPLTVSAAWTPPVGDPFFDAYQQWRGEIERFDAPWNEYGEALSKYFGGVVAICETVAMSDSAAVLPAEFRATGGFYTDSNGTQKYGVIINQVQSISSVGYEEPWPVPFVSLADRVYTIAVVPNYASSTNWENEWRFDPETGASNVVGVYVRRFHNHVQERLYSDWLISDGSDYVGGSTSTVYDYHWRLYITSENVAPVWPGISAALSSSSPVLGRGVTIDSLPQSTLYPTITRDNISDYITDVLNPATVTENPALEPFLFVPPEPYEPIYPTDFAEGIPKAWTVENPRLPSYSLDLQLPTADFEEVDISTPLEHHATGIRFWWALLGEVLDHFGVKELVLFALALGLIITILTRLGR